MYLANKFQNIRGSADTLLDLAELTQEEMRPVAEAMARGGRLAQAGLAADIAAEQARAQTTARLFSGIDGGTASLADIEDAAARGEITASDRGALIAALDAKRARDERDAQGIARVGAVLRGDGGPLDPNDEGDRAAADAYYARVLAPVLMNGPPDTGGADRQIAEFAARTGIVPSAVVARARAEMSFGTPAEQPGTARLVAPSLSWNDEECERQVARYRDLVSREFEGAGLAL